MKSRVQVIAGWVLSGAAGLMITASGIFKLLSPPEVVEGLTKLGVGPYITVLGTMEIAFAVLFLIPKTTKLGFILISCYFAGAIATDLSHGNSLVNASFPIILTWIAAFVRRPDIFLDNTATT